MGRTQMSKNELGRVEVLARVKSKQLRVVDAAPLLRVSYRQAKRLWKLYREEGAAGLKHRSAGRPSHRAYEAKFRRKVLRLVREKYSGAVGERFGPTLTTELLESEDELKVDAEPTLTGLGTVTTVSTTIYGPWPVKASPGAL